MLGDILAADAFALFLVFTRMGTALMLMPGVGDGTVSPRIRLLLSLFLAFLTTPLIAETLPAPPESVFGLGFLLVGEVIVGLILGLSARLLMAAVDVAGTIISYHLSLANAQAFNPMMASQGSLVGSFLTLTALVLIFATNLHHLFFLAIRDSYTVFVPGEIPPMADAADMIARLVANSFLIGAQMSAPFLIIGLVFYLGLGLLARLMPQVQIFFIAIPIQIILGFLIFSLVLSGIMLFWLGEFEASLFRYLAP